MNNNFRSISSPQRSSFFAAILLSLFAFQANAALLTANFDFTVAVNDAADQFVITYGLTTGDTVSGSAVFDNTGFTGAGFESFEILNASDFTISIGSLVLDAADDVDFASPGLPSIDFLDGEFLRFQFLADVDAGGSLYEVSLEDAFEVVAPTGAIVVVNQSGINVNVIPVPAALPLMVSALAGLGLWRRRRIC